MAKQKKQRYTGVVFSTDPQFRYVEEQGETEIYTPEPAKQHLKVCLDKKQRGGKTVTLVSGFTGRDEDRVELGKKLKQKCGVGGTVKDQEIIIQGDFKSRVYELLQEMGYRVKISGG